VRPLITGASGFLGRQFLEVLAARGTPARALVSPRGPRELPRAHAVVAGDLLDRAALLRACEGVTQVIHLAARVHRADDSAAAFQRDNVEGTRALLEAAAAAGATDFLFMSSVKAMGEKADGVLDEGTPPRPSTPYGRSKLEAEEVAIDAGNKLGLRVVVVRLPTVYGPGVTGNILRLLEAAHRGRRLPFGAIRNRRSMIFSGTAVEASLAALAWLKDAPAGRHVYLACDERAYSTAEVYAAMCRAMGRAPLLRSVPVPLLTKIGRAGDVVGRLLGRTMPIDSSLVARVAGDLEVSCAKLARDTGFRPTIDLDEGMRRTVAWYRDRWQET
jgi:nucleoside-diphosphate-sugar epimerase